MMINYFKIIDSIWFEVNNPVLKGMIGIVAVRNKLTNETKFYIGLAEGDDIDIDEKTILQHGSLFYPSGMDLWIQDMEEMQQFNV